MRIKELKQLIDNMDPEGHVKIYGIDSKDKEHYLNIRSYKRDMGNLTLHVSGRDFRAAMQQLSDRNISIAHA
jgi:hypothetical protein